MRRRSSPLNALTSFTKAVHSESEKQVYFVSGKPHHAGCVVDSGGTTQTPSLLCLERVLLRDGLRRAHARGHAGTWSAAQPGSPSANRGRIHAEPGRDFPPACASSLPSRAMPATRTEECLPMIARGNSLRPGNPAPHRLRKRKDLPAAEFFVQAAQISWENAAALGQQHPDAFIKASLAVRHGPIGRALIEEHRAKPDQPRVDDLIHGRGGAGSSSCATVRSKQASNSARSAGWRKSLARSPCSVRHRMVAASNSRTPGVIMARRSESPAQPGEDDGIGFTIEHRVDIHELDAAPRQLGPIGRFAHVGLGAE